MEDVGKLESIRNVFFAPLASLTAAQTRETAQPTESGFASSLVSAHDHHNIEIKTVTELSSAPSLVETDIFLFVPRNFELGGYGKSELIKDFRSRVKLAVPVSGEQGPAALEEALTGLRFLLRTSTENEGNEDGEAFNHFLHEEVHESAKDVAAILAETLKHRIAENTRRFLWSHSLMTISSTALSGIEQLRLDLDETAGLLRTFRSSVEHRPKLTDAVLTFLDEYISHLYIQYLSAIRAEFERFKTPKSVENDLCYAQGRNRLEETLDTHQEQEAQHRASFGSKPSTEESELEREQRLVRLSHLKKFFQSKMFVDITRQQPAAKISESTATIGTAVAAIVAAALEFYARPAVAEAAFQGLFVLSFGVIVYVLRDRFKDRAKVVFHKKALQFLPDFEQRLIAKDMRIGRVKEWFQIMRSQDLPLDVVTLRRAACTSELERRLPEDVFLCRKIQEVDASTLANGSGNALHSRALYENTRVNFERYLKHMDDVFKDLTDLDTSGRFHSSRSHRVYYFYLCVKTITAPLDNSMTGKIRPVHTVRDARNTQSLLYRIVLDKNGIVRLEEVKPD